MLSFLFIALAAIFKAVADTLQHHYGSSIFRKYNPNWWNPAISWKHVGFVKYTKYRPDAWHLANSGMICAFIAAVVVFNPGGKIPDWLDYFLFGAAFVAVFNFFYNKVLR